MFDGALKSEIDKMFNSVCIRKMFVILSDLTAILDSILYSRMEK